MSVLVESGFFWLVFYVVLDSLCRGFLICVVF